MCKLGFMKRVGCFPTDGGLGDKTKCSYSRQQPSCLCWFGIFDLDKLIHGDGIKLGVHSDVPLIYTVISLYWKCGKLGIGRSLFDEMVITSLSRGVP